MADIAIKVQHLGKKYQIRHEGRERYQTLREALARQWGSLWHPPQKGGVSVEDFWALKDVSFEVKRGECLGIIGRNGAGKSTLLKTLSRITEPTTGRIELHGRVASLLEVGTGFHPELTGRENIYLNGVILGMTRKEMSRKFDDIVAFSEMEKFIDTPVKRYSSGMYMRLAFAVAAHLDAEIMVVDEVLAVGDINFRAKCLGKMKDISENAGRTVLFVSHDMGSIRQLCRQVLLLAKGEVLKIGATDEVTAFYEETSLQESQEYVPTKIRKLDSRHYYLNKVELRNATGTPCCRFAAGEVIEVHLWSNGQAPVGRYTIEFILFNARGNRISFGAANPVQNTYFRKEDTHFVCKLGPLPLTMGVYAFYFSVRVWGMERWDEWENAIQFEITQCDLFGTGHDVPGGGNGDFIINQQWFCGS